MDTSVETGPQDSYSNSYRQYRLSRAAIEISGDMPKDVYEEVLYASFDLDARSLDDRTLPYLLTIGFIETTLNIDHVNALSQRDTVPETIVFTTRDEKGRVVSIREFGELKFRSSSCGYAKPAKIERPLHKIVYAGTLLSAEYFPVERDSEV